MEHHADGHEEHQAEERAFWGDCSNTYGEETKQFKYAELMGIGRLAGGNPFRFDGAGLSWVDFGGGPTSMLLKFQGATRRMVIDPLGVPDWVKLRYRECGVKYAQMRCDVAGVESVARDPQDEVTNRFDIGLCYNVLQHVENPRSFARNLALVSRQQLVFEWIEIPPHPGHPNMLTQEKLEGWFGQRGIVGELHGENRCVGKYWVLRL